MPPQTATFPCPFCGRRMGVPAELLGKQVRCPHCKQVVLAPLSAAPSGVVPAVNLPPAPPPPPPPPPPPVAPPPPPEPEIPTFSLPARKEAADSILSDPDESEDEVFGSQPGARLSTVPPLDLTDPISPPPPADADNPFEFPATAATTATGPSDATPPAPRPAPPAAPTQGPTAELPNPFLELEPVTLPAVFAQSAGSKSNAPATPPQPFPPAPAPVRPAPVAPASVVSNPFAGIDETVTRVPTSAPAPVPAPAPAEADDTPRRRKKRDDATPEEKSEKPARSGRSRAAAPQSGAVTVLLFVVLGYAVLATGLAVYALFFRGDKFGPEHPLSTIPDNFGEFEPAARKKVSRYEFKVDGELPAQQRAALGEKAVVGQIEVQPVRIVKRRLTIDVESTRGETRRESSPTAALVLTLNIKNTSSDLTLHPMDPAFTRKAVTGRPEPFTRLVVSKQKYFAGGFLDWPLDPNRVKKRQEVQQANDVVPLKPGEQREYVVFTDAKPEIVTAAETSKETMQWRVQVRRDPVEVNGKEVPVTAIVGVDFRATDIKLPD